MSEALNLEEKKVVREPFIVDNDMKAEWCLNKIRKIREEQNRDNEELERQMKFYKDQMDLNNKEADEDVAFFESMLRPYFNSRVADGFTKATKTKISYKLPTGELIMKHRDPEFEYKKEQDQAIAFLEKNKMDQFVKTKKELNWKDLKPLTQIVGNTVVVTETGEVIPGITATEREDEFSVEVKLYGYQF